MKLKFSLSVVVACRLVRALVAPVIENPSPLSEAASVLGLLCTVMSQYSTFRSCVEKNTALVLLPLPSGYIHSSAGDLPSLNLR